MVKESDPRRNRLPRRSILFGSTVLALAAVASACGGKEAKEPSPFSQTPTITPAGEQLKTPPSIQTPEVTQTPEATKVPEIKSQVEGKMLVKTSEDQLWYVNLKTSEKILITDQVTSEGSGDIGWSPSGDKFTVRVKDKQNRLDLYEIFDAKGNLLAKFGDIAAEPFIFPESPSWSPDGNSLVYVQDTGIFVLDLNTNESHQIIVTDETFYDFKNPIFSPDGKKLIFAYDGPDGLEVDLVNFDPEKFPYNWDERDKEQASQWLKTIYRNEELNYYGDFRFRWTQDSKNVGFVVGDYETPMTIFVTNVDEGTAQEITKPDCGNDNPDKFNNNDWSLSPDDKQIVFGCSEEKYKRGGIYLVDITGANQRKVLTLKDLPLEVSQDVFSCPRWTPDGKQIVFAGEKSVYIFNPDGSGLKEVLAVPDEILSIYWSPK